MNEESMYQMDKTRLFEIISEYNKQLQGFGCKQGIGLILYGCKTHGRLYEQKYYPQNNEIIIKPTPMNCLAVITHHDPDLIIKLIHLHEYEQFLKLVSKIGMCLEIAVTKFSIKEIPEEWK